MHIATLSGIIKLGWHCGVYRLCNLLERADIANSIIRKMYRLLKEIV